MVVSGVLRLYGEELNQHVVIIWGSFLMSNRFQIPLQGRAERSLLNSGRGPGRHFYLSYLVWIFLSEHPEKEGLLFLFYNEETEAQEGETLVCQREWQGNG